MDVQTLSSSLDIVAPACGQTLSVDQKVAVETSLSVLKADNSFDKVVFWGRISGIQCDYLIAQGYNLPYAMIEATSNPAVSFYRCVSLLFHSFRAHPGSSPASPRACAPLCLHRVLRPT